MRLKIDDDVKIELEKSQIFINLFNILIEQVKNKYKLPINHNITLLNDLAKKGKAIFLQFLLRLFKIDYNYRSIGDADKHVESIDTQSTVLELHVLLRLRDSIIHAINIPSEDFILSINESTEQKRSINKKGCNQDPDSIQVGLKNVDNNRAIKPNSSSQDNDKMHNNKKIKNTTLYKTI
ncbi:hypothetical protein EKK58_03250 [Candidatus Dependentiae bacterium]|nr:MAG: hypothetical protein EKK58_03250 [Candidatus Dependentiae bacterium]